MCHGANLDQSQHRRKTESFPPGRSQSRADLRDITSLKFLLLVLLFKHLHAKLGKCFGRFFPQLLACQRTGFRVPMSCGDKKSTTWLLTEVKDEAEADWKSSTTSAQTRLVVLPCGPGKIYEQCLKTGDHRFLPHPSRFIIHNSRVFDATGRLTCAVEEILNNHINTCHRKYAETKMK